MSEKVTIGGEMAYPIYRLSAKWVQDGDHKDSGEWQTNGLPEGRVWNSIGSHYCMTKEEKDPQALADEWGRVLKPKMVEKYAKVNPITGFSGSGELVCYETWCLTWFCHQTFDDGRSDAEYLESFQRYVDRHRWYQDHLSHYTRNPQDKPSNAPEHLICLMGADDWWRWHGKDNDSPPPCRCEGCTKLGVVRIGH